MELDAIPEEPILYCVHCGSKWDHKYGTRPTDKNCPDCQRTLNLFILVPVGLPGLEQLIEGLPRIKSENP